MLREGGGKKIIAIGANSAITSIEQNETVSAQGILADRLQDPKKLQELGSFMVEVLKKRQESNRIAGYSIVGP